MKGLIPEAERGGLAEHIQGERCKFGPFTFGGGRNFPFSESMDPAGAAGNSGSGSGGGAVFAGKKSQRQYMQGKGRDRIGGSTTHMDGEMSMCGGAEGTCC